MLRRAAERTRRRVAPARERGLKCQLHHIQANQTVVAPARERGLKLLLPISLQTPTAVAPARERGLKLRDMNGIINSVSRSREGAWIEIFAIRYAVCSLLSLPRGSVD